MRKFYFISLLFISISTYSQEQLPFNYAEFNIGRCFHGSGDIRGLIFTTEYARYFKKKFSWSVGLSGTIHDGSYPEFFTVNGQEIDGSVRYTVAGVQVNGHIGYSILRNSEHELQARLGAIFRYQSSSLPSDVTTLYPPATGLAFPVVVFNNTVPQRTFAPGGSIQIRYNYSINKKVTIGLMGGFQADTEGDNLSQLCLTTGIRF